MHYKYVWRGLEEMFEFAHLHKNGSQLCWGRFCGDAPLLCSGALLCLGALPLLYPAAPPSVFAFGKYTAPAVALVREVSAMLGSFFYQWRYALAGQALLLLNPSQLR